MLALTACCELPDEDKEAGKDLVGKLELCLYGIRDAARGWQECLASHLVEVGFDRGVAHSCVFKHSEWNLITVVHGDDYVTSGPPEGLYKMQKALEARFELGKTVNSHQHVSRMQPGFGYIWSFGESFI